MAAGPRDVAAISAALRKEIDRSPWVYPWRFAPGVTARLYSDHLASVHETRAELIEAPVRSALNAAGARARALDLACCEGWFGHRLLDWGASEVVGIDVLEANIARAELVRAHFGIDASRLRFRHGNVFALTPHELGTFDVVLVLGLIYHVEDPAGALRVARRLTRSLCMIETQLTRQLRPIVHGWGHPDRLMQAEASFAAIIERESTEALASVPGTLSLIPNRAAAELLARTAGFGDVDFVEPLPRHDVQYLRGDRAVIAARPVATGG